MKGSKSLRLTQGSSRSKISDLRRESDILDWNDLLSHTSSGNREWGPGAGLGQEQGQGQGQGGRRSIKPVFRAHSLRSTSSGGYLESMSMSSMENMTAAVRGRKLSTQNDALKELSMQDEQMAHCEDRLHSLCSHFNINAEHLLNKISADLLLLV